jgi:hypothetical protein
MKMICLISPFLVAVLSSMSPLASGFQDRLPTTTYKTSSSYSRSSSNFPKPTFLSMKNDANNPYTIAAEQMKNLKPEDIERMIKEMDSMNPIQAGALKAMGMVSGVIEAIIIMSFRDMHMYDLNQHYHRTQK